MDVFSRIYSGLDDVLTSFSWYIYIYMLGGLEMASMKIRSKEKA